MLPHQTYRRRRPFWSLAVLALAFYVGLRSWGSRFFGSPAFFFPMSGTAPEELERLRHEVDTIQSSMRSKGLTDSEIDGLSEAIKSSEGLKEVMMPLCTNSEVSMSVEGVSDAAGALVATMNVQRRYTQEERQLSEELEPFVVYAVQQELAGNRTDSERAVGRLVDQGMASDLAQFHVAQRVLMHQLQSKSTYGVWFSGIQRACAAAKEEMLRPIWQDVLSQLDGRGVSITEASEILSLGLSLHRATKKLAGAS